MPTVLWVQVQVPSWSHDALSKEEHVPHTNLSIEPTVASVGRDVDRLSLGFILPVDTLSRGLDLTQPRDGRCSGGGDGYRRVSRIDHLLLLLLLLPPPRRWLHLHLGRAVDSQ